MNTADLKRVTIGGETWIWHTAWAACVAEGVNVEPLPEVEHPALIELIDRASRTYTQGVQRHCQPGTSMPLFALASDGRMLGLWGAKSTPTILIDQGIIGAIEYAIGTSVSLLRIQPRRTRGVAAVYNQHGDPIAFVMPVRV